LKNTGYGGKKQGGVTSSNPNGWQGRGYEAKNEMKFWGGELSKKKGRTGTGMVGPFEQEERNRGTWAERENLGDSKKGGRHCKGSRIGSG